MAHKRLEQVDWDAADRSIAERRAKYLGIPMIANPFPQAVRSKPDYRWQTVCESCGLNVIYVAPAERPEVTQCTRCKKGKSLG